MDRFKRLDLSNRLQILQSSLPSWLRRSRLANRISKVEGNLAVEPTVTQEVGGPVTEIKYLRENTTPQDFMRSPLEPFDSEFKVTIRNVAERVEEKASEIAGVPSLLHFGNELELIFFSDDYDPRNSEDRLRDPKNLTPEHIRSVSKLVEEMSKPQEDGGLRDIIYADVQRIGKLSVELRIQPSTVDEYFERMERVRGWIEQHTEELHMRPVVTNHHIHMSLLSENENVNIFEDPNVVKKIAAGVVDIYHRAMPLLRLPSEIEPTLADPSRKPERNEIIIGKLDYGIIANREWKTEGASRVEARYNSSEFAFNPYTDLLLNLMGVDRGLTVLLSNQPDVLLDTDYPLSRDKVSSYAVNEHLPYFSQFEFKWDEIVDRLPQDFVLNGYISHDLLVRVKRILATYKSISLGEMSLPESRKFAKQELENARIQKQSTIERLWYRDANKFFTREEANDALLNGVMISVPNEGLNYVVKGDQENLNNLLRPQVFNFMEKALEKWKNQMGVSYKDLQVSIVGLYRTEEEQETFNQVNGIFNTPKEDSHLAGVSFDIDLDELFKLGAYGSLSAGVLKDIFKQLQSEEKCNVLFTNNSKVMHVCVSPEIAGIKNDLPDKPISLMPNPFERTIIPKIIENQLTPDQTRRLFSYINYDKPPQGDIDAIVVLGVRKGGRDYKLRLALAEEYALSHPNAKIIISGKGDKEVSVAEQMKSDLVAKGIDADRIREEKRSRDTQEGVRYSLNMLKPEHQAVVYLGSNYIGRRVALSLRKFAPNSTKQFYIVDADVEKNREENYDPIEQVGDALEVQNRLLIREWRRLAKYRRRREV